jgi:hypothetical protein
VQASVADRGVLAGVLFSVVAAVAFLFSAPPHVTVAGIQLPMPESVVGQFTTAFRATARFASLVMLGLCVMAAIALAQLLPRAGRKTRIVAVAVLAVIVTGDLWARSPTITHITVPRIVRVLARQPAGIYAEYPLQNGTSFGGNSASAFYQGFAGAHNLFGGFFPDTTSETEKLSLSYLLAPRTLPALAGFGVRYLLVDRVTAGLAPPMYPSYGGSIPGARLISSDPYATLYRVTAPPPRLESFAMSGFSLPEGPGPRFWQWMTATSGRLEILSEAARPIRARVSFVASSYAVARRVTINDGPDRPPLYTGIVPHGSTIRISFEVTLRRNTWLTLTATPPPISPHTLASSNTDTRSLAIQVFEPLSIIPEGG